MLKNQQQLNFLKVLDISSDQLGDPYFVRHVNLNLELFLFYKTKIKIKYLCHLKIIYY